MVDRVPFSAGSAPMNQGRRQVYVCLGELVLSCFREKKSRKNFPVAKTATLRSSNSITICAWRRPTAPTELDCSHALIALAMP